MIKNRTDSYHSDPEILGCTPVFTGTRLPLDKTIEHLAAGDSIDAFLDRFPTVLSHDQVTSFVALTSAEALEDAAFGEAMREGETTASADRGRVFQLFED